MSEKSRGGADGTTVVRDDARHDRVGAIRTLVVMSPAGIERHPLPPSGAVTLGRAKDNAIRLEHESVSRHHARIELGVAPVIEDLGSANGVTFDFGHRLGTGERAVIRPGQVVALGDVFVFIHDTTRAIGADGTVVDPVMQDVHTLVQKIAPSDLAVLIVGETGTGKELVAREIHASSKRSEGPFTVVSCGAIAPSMAEAELFGYERGAFSGAVSSKPGLVEAAAGGTLFFDSVSELAPDVQAALLRVLAERRVRRLGAVDERIVDARFVSATNRELSADVEHGRFRRDLYFRLNAITVRVPPLRERRAEIESLAVRFHAEAHRAAFATEAPPLPAEVLGALSIYAWPGNVRELRHAIERAMLLAQGGPLRLDDLPEAIVENRAPASEPPPAPEGDAAAHRRRIVEALEQSAGNQTRAAELLGVSRRTLTNWLERYDFPRPRKR